MPRLWLRVLRGDMIAAPAGVKILERRSPWTAGVALTAWLLYAGSSGAQSVLRSDLHLSFEASGPSEDPRLGWVRADAAVEAAGIGGVPVASDQRRGDTADRITACRTR